MVSSTYSRSAARYQRIPRAETVRLIRAAQRGGAKGKTAMQTLCEQNLGLVQSIAGRYNPRLLPPTTGRDDLVAEGLLGLMHAVRKFDIARGTQFSTYAVWWVRQRIQRFLQQQQPITTSIHILGRRDRLSRAADTFLVQHGRQPNRDELADLANLTGPQVDRASNLPRAVYSLDGPAQDPDGSAPFPGDAIAGPDDLGPLVARLDAAALSDFLDRYLTAEQCQVLRLRLGLHPRFPAGQTDRQIGHRLGVSKQRVNYVYQQALDRLRSPIVACRLLAMLRPEA